MINGDLAHAFDLPDRPAELLDAPVAAWSQPVTLSTYLPEQPDRYPAYLDQRVYQGSSGRVFPLPFHDRISQARTEHRWQGLHLENAYVRVLVLPELGGRIHLVLDRRTGYPLFYANSVIKPALVGLAGPWLAGGVEFNWPQHHRPATFLPTAWSIEASDARDEATLWCSDHDPFARMKGMHGVRLTADSTVVELRARLYNRSDEPQTFLWWANVAAETHSDYQSFFPADVHVVADHAKRAVTTFPAANGRYYGVDYPDRRGDDRRSDSDQAVPGDRLDWYRNIPVPTSYMCVGSHGDFFGGYDHRADAGFVHWADHHVAVGKKQWSWGDSDFGRAWNANLADDDSTYIELMAGVYTDNQPDFSHLAPGETKVFSQYWYPLAETGPAVAATLDAALGVVTGPIETMIIIDATRPVAGAEVIISQGDVVAREAADLHPDRRWTVTVPTTAPLSIMVTDHGREVLSWSDPRSGGNRADEADAELPAAAYQPAPPAKINSVEELFLTGQHLAQYRHATRSPEPYWQDALRRDPGHWASHVGLAGRRYRAAEYGAALDHLRAAVARLTALNPNPTDGEAHHLLGLTLLRLGRDDEAYVAFAKATWLRAWVGVASHQLAVLDARHGRDAAALDRVETTLRVEPEHLQARALRAVLLRRLGRTDEARWEVEDTLGLDPLDVWARDLARPLDAAAAAHNLLEAQTLLDLGIEYARVGELVEAVRVLRLAVERDADRPLGQTACAVLAGYHLAGVLDRSGDTEGAASARAAARSGDRTWNFASRLDDVAALETGLVVDPDDATASALLGHWLYAHDRPADAVDAWRRSTASDPSDPVVWRNLAVAAVNHDHNDRAGLAHYDRALALAPTDGRLWYESDQLLKRVGTPVEERIERLATAGPSVADRDDVAAELANLLVSAGRPAEAIAVLTSRTFQPWEGGEGQVLRAWERTQLALAHGAATGAAAVSHVERAIRMPANLGEARHPLANPARLLFELGAAAAATADDHELAVRSWRTAADAVGDFAAMAPEPYSENTFFSVLAARRLGDHDLAAVLVAGLRVHVDELAATPAVIDYFATSLPAMLLFHDDPQQGRDRLVTLLRAQLAFLDDDRAVARGALAGLLRVDPGDDLALDLSARLDSPATTLHPDVRTSR